MERIFALFAAVIAAFVFAPAAARESDAIVFVDERVPEPQSFLNESPPGTRLVIVRHDEDGLRRVESVAGALGDLRAIHIVAHGEPGLLKLGHADLDLAAVRRDRARLTAIGRSLRADSDILLYGCNVGRGARGAAFVSALAAATRADVAASSNATGSQRLGADWVLEVQTGPIESASIAKTSDEYPYRLDPTDLAGAGAWTTLHRGSQFDPVGDTQANKAGTEIIGDAGHSTTYANYDDNGTTGGVDPELDDILSVRMRIGDETKATHSAYAFFGFDADADGQLDGFISSGASTTAIWDAGTDLNLSPATTDIAGSPYASYAQVPGDNYNFATVSALNDPDWDGNADLNADGNTDVFVSLSIPVVDLDAFLATQGIIFTPTTQLRFVSLTATQTNSLNADFNGVSDGATSDWTQSFAALGLYSDPVDSTGVVDTTPPATPTVTSQTTSDSTPTVGGTAEADSTVDVEINTVTYSTTATGGTWSVTVPGIDALGDGSYDVAVTSTDAAANSSTDATTNELVIDTVPPPVAIVSAPRANIANASGYPVTGNCSNGAGNVTVGIPSATPASRNITCSAGNWSTTFDLTAIPDGTDVVAVDAEQTDPAGNTGTDSQTADKDTIAPLLAITDNGSGGDDTFDAVEATAVAVSGTTDAEDGQTVTVAFDDGVNPAIGATANTAGGAWTTTAADISGLNDGNIVITADVTDAAGNPSAQASDTAAIGGAGPLLTADDVFASTGLPTFGGTTDQPASRLVTVRDQLSATLCAVAPATAAPVNTWSCASTAPVDEGSYTFTAEVDDDLGNSEVVSFVVEVDLDADDDGLPDALEGGADTDGDGVPDFQDPDSDNDGIADATEDTGLPPLTGGDVDGDGIDNAIDADATGGPDADGNGVDDGFEASDVDADGVPDYLDTDADADGIPDLVEGDVDSDADGLADFLDTDADNDGIPDAVEDDNMPPLAGSDADFDGVDDALDADATGGVDADGDGIDDALMPTDTDADGLANYVDPDSNNDGVPDAFGAAAGPPPGANDADGDTLPDYLEADSDGDGIPDTVETNVSGVDSDFDGIDDAFDVDQTGGTDANGDGIDDAAPRDFDNDGTPDMQDLDSDNDGLPDVIEAGLADADADGDGRVDDGSIIGMPPDTDGSGDPDYVDLDSDGDGINDIVGTPAEPFDGDGDGQIDPANAADGDGDGIPDVVDPDSAASNPGIDSDGDGMPDGIDGDDDNDGIPDELEMTDGADRDTDGDGVVDRLDLDSDGDNLADSLENGDFDADGTVDYLQVDGGLETAVTGSGVGIMEVLGMVVLIVWVALRRVKAGRLGLPIVPIVLMVVGALPFADPARAADDLLAADESPRWYIAGGAGITHVDPEGESNGWSTSNDRGEGFKILAGYRLRPHWFAELAYTDAGEAELDNVNPAIGGTPAITYDIASLFVGYALRQSHARWNLYAKLGGSIIWNDVTDDRVDYDKQTATQLAVGVGGIWRFGRKWSARVELDAFDRDARYLGLAVGYDLGRSDGR